MSLPRPSSQHLLLATLALIHCAGSSLLAAGAGAGGNIFGGAGAGGNSVITIGFPTFPIIPIPGIPSTPSLPSLPTIPKPTLPGLGGGSTSGTKNLGSCPTFNTLAGFVKDEYDGLWYVYQQYNNPIENGWSCKRLTYDQTSNAFTYAFRSNNVDSSYTGTYTVPTATTGAISVSLSYMLALGADSYGNVNQFVVAGEEDSYAIIRSCTNFGLLNQQYAYILTRDPMPDALTLAAIATAVGTSGLDASQLQTIDQTC